MKIIHLSLLLALGLNSLPSLARDTTAPITIEADRLEMSQLDGRSHYHGNVHLQQGKMSLRADTLEIIQQEGQLQRAIAQGRPAIMEMPDEQTGQLIRGHARQMNYRLADDTVEMRGEAILWRGKDEFRGDHLIYQIGLGQVQAFGSTRSDGVEGRVRIILQQDGRQ